MTLIAQRTAPHKRKKIISLHSSEPVWPRGKALGW